MNTYTINHGGQRPDTIINGDRIELTPNRELKIWLGTNLMFLTRSWQDVQTSECVDLGYEAKIKELETLNGKLRAENKLLYQTIELRSSISAELRKQRNDYKQKLNSLYGRTRFGTFKSDEYVDTDTLHDACVERTELRWDGEPLVITCRRERCHEGRHSAVQVGYLW